MIQESVIPKIRQETNKIKITYELKKDLQEDEVICPHCHGTGINISENIYGIRGDVTHIGVHFPYKHQSLHYCQHCYNGIQKKCPECGAMRGRSNGECHCGYDAKMRYKKWAKENIKKRDKAEDIPLSEAFEKFKCLYIDNTDEYAFDEDGLECEIENFMDSDGDLNELRIYGTTETQISIDADDVIESVCEDLHEDARDVCDGEGLQKLLDEWCKEQSGTATYYPDYKYRIVLSDDYNKKYGR